MVERLAGNYLKSLRLAKELQELAKEVKKKTREKEKKGV
jgi:hypothetical protein